METKKVKELLKLLEEFRDHGGVDDTFNIEHVIEDVDSWLIDTDALRDDKIKADHE